MVLIEQDRAAFGQDSNLSVIPLGTEVMDASLRPWTLVQPLYVPPEVFWVLLMRLLSPSAFPGLPIMSLRTM